MEKMPRKDNNDKKYGKNLAKQNKEKTGKKWGSTNVKLTIPKVHQNLPTSTTSPKTYAQVLEGWQNSVPKLYPYPQEQIKVTVQRKSGEVDDITPTTPRSEKLPNTERTPIRKKTRLPNPVGLTSADNTPEEGEGHLPGPSKKVSAPVYESVNGNGIGTPSDKDYGLVNPCVRPFNPNDLVASAKYAPSSWLPDHAYGPFTQAKNHSTLVTTGAKVEKDCTEFGHTLEDSFTSVSQAEKTSYEKTAEWLDWHERTKNEEKLSCPQKTGSNASCFNCEKLEEEVCKVHTELMSAKLQWKGLVDNYELIKYNLEKENYQLRSILRRQTEENERFLSGMDMLDSAIKTSPLSSDPRSKYSESAISQMLKNLTPSYSSPAPACNIAPSFSATFPASPSLPTPSNSLANFAAPLLETPSQKIGRNMGRMKEYVEALNMQYLYDPQELRKTVLAAMNDEDEPENREKPVDLPVRKKKINNTPGKKTPKNKKN